MRSLQWIGSTIKYLLILLFLYAAISKFLDFTSFHSALFNSPIFKNTSAPDVLAWGIPLIELLVVILLLIPDMKRSGLFLAAILMTLFTVYIGGLLFFSKELPCSCGGIISSLTWQQHLIFNIAFTLLTYLGIYINNKNNPSF